jgi:hypothetical protein
VRENRSPGSEGGESLEGLFSTPIDAMDGKAYKHIHVFWMSAIPADMTAYLAMATNTCVAAGYLQLIPRQRLAFGDISQN